MSIHNHIAEEQLRQTANLIWSEPTEVSFIRKPGFEDDGQGGRRRAAGDPTTLDAQTLYVGEKRYDATFNVEQQGERLIESLVLVGMPDLNIKQGDKFTLFGQEFKVTHIHWKRTFETRAEAKVATDGN